MPRGRKEKPAQVIAGLPQPPPHLTPTAKILFEAIVADLVKQGSCVATDAHLIALYAETRDYATELRKKIDDADPTNKSEGYGALKRHPLIDPYLAAVKSAALYLTKLGLTPASRPKSAMGEDDVTRFHE